MRLSIHYGTCILATIQVLLSVAWATPKLGIRPDYLRPVNDETDRDIQSYSGIIRFQDGTLPLDKTRMTDAKLLNLCVVAYNEMVSSWRGRNLKSSALPGAMTAVAYRDKIYFASSLKRPYKGIKFANVPKGSIRELMEEALTMGLGRSIPVSTIDSHAANVLGNFTRLHIYVTLFSRLLLIRES